MSRPENPDLRRRELLRIYRALQQDERDGVDRQARLSAERQARDMGFSIDSNPDRWQIEVQKLRDAIRDRMLTPDDWARDDAAEALKRSVLEDAARLRPTKRGTRRASGGFKKGAKRPVRGGKDASISEREGADDHPIPST